MEPVAVRSVGQTLKQRLLEYAAQRLGRDGLAARLKVSEATLDAWIDGRAEMPAPKQLALADRPLSREELAAAVFRQGATEMHFLDDRPMLKRIAVTRESVEKTIKVIALTKETSL